MKSFASLVILQYNFETTVILYTYLKRLQWIILILWKVNNWKQPWKWKRNYLTVGFLDCSEKFAKKAKKCNANPVRVTNNSYKVRKRHEFLISPRSPNGIFVYILRFLIVGINIAKNEAKPKKRLEVSHRWLLYTQTVLKI